MDESDYQENLEARVSVLNRVLKIIKTGGSCSICGYSDEPGIIQPHHVAGKFNSDITVPICLNCHGILSLRQNSWDRRFSRPGNSPRLKMGFLLLGESELLLSQGRTLRTIALGIINNPEEWYT